MPSWTDEDRHLGMALAWGEKLGGAAFCSALASGELDAAWAEPEEALLLRWPDLGQALAAAKPADAAAWGAGARRAQARWVGWGEPDYPEAWVALLGPRAPAAIQVQGLWPPQRPVVAVVGTRKPSPVGLRVAEALGRGLCEGGVGVASGLAAGVDGAAHRGALAAGGPTWAFLGSGLDHRYPKAHAGLAEAILAEGGALVSPWAPQAPPQPWRFLARNELLASLALGTVVVEAPLRSGSIHSAGVAARAGREVLAVPGCVEWPNAAGCNALLRDGATPVVDASQVLESLGLLGLAPPVAQGPKAPGPAAAGDRLVWEALRQGAQGLEELLPRCGLNASSLLVALGRLEAEGHVRRHLFGYEALA